MESKVDHAPVGAWVGCSSPSRWINH